MVRSGAIGLMQLLPSTAHGIALHTGGSKLPRRPRDPEINVRYGSWYLRHLIDKYDDEQTALAAYNAGQANVDGWLAQGRYSLLGDPRVRRPGRGSEGDLPRHLGTELGE